MTSLRPPGLGPIVGHTTANSCRLWIRASDPQDDGAALNEHRRTVALCCVVAIDGQTRVAKSKKRIHYFRLHREFDRTGTINLGVERGITDSADPEPLEPDTEYRVRLGTLTLDDSGDADETVTDEELAERLPKAEVWRRDFDKFDANVCEASFRTMPSTTAKDAGDIAFLVGSCRYPGLLWKAKRADVIFGPMRREAAGECGGRSRANHVLMVGDQIYADMLNRSVPIGLADTFEEFQSRYLNAFGSPHMRRLLREFPTYMVLDDHEIEDNWSQDRLKSSKSRRVFNVAIGAYMSYQWSHCPRTYGRRLFYQFDCGGYPFFALDTRTQRFMDDVAESLADNHLLGRPALPDEDPSQLAVLLHWLQQTQEERGNIPKFIVSSSVFAPNPMSAREQRAGANEQLVKWKEGTDSWPAFPNTRRAILNCIVEHGVQNVVFVSGDIHCSNVAQMRISGTAAASKLKLFSVTSSAFYWPFPFADGEPSDYVHDSTAPGQEDTFDLGDGLSMDYTASSFTQEDNYCRVDLNRKSATLKVMVFDSNGEVVEKGGWFGRKSTPLVTELRLAKW